MARGKLTPKFIAEWLPGTQRQYQSDGSIPGFGAYLFPSGKVSFHLMYRDRSGKQHKATLKASNADAARIEALELLARIGKGDVPTPQRLLSGGPTLMAVVKGYIAAQGPKYRSGDSFIANFENHLFPVVRPDMPFEHIRRSEVIALLDPIVARGHRHAADTVVKQFNAVARWHSDRVDTYTWKPVPRQLTDDDKAPRGCTAKRHCGR
jgi:hypothetical protein